MDLKEGFSKSYKITLIYSSILFVLIFFVDTYVSLISLGPVFVPEFLREYLTKPSGIGIWSGQSLNVLGWIYVFVFLYIFMLLYKTLENCVFKKDSL